MNSQNAFVCSLKMDPLPTCNGSPTPPQLKNRPDPFEPGTLKNSCENGCLGCPAQRRKARSHRLAFPWLGALTSGSRASQLWGGAALAALRKRVTGTDRASAPEVPKKYWRSLDRSQPRFQIRKDIFHVLNPHRNPHHAISNSYRLPGLLTQPRVSHRRRMRNQRLHSP